MHNYIFLKKHFVSGEHLHLYFLCGYKICEFSFLQLLVLFRRKLSAENLHFQVHTGTDMISPIFL